MPRFVALLSALICLPLSIALGQSPGKTPPDQPKLVVYIVVEQMRYDYLDRFWDKLGNGGFKRLAGQGAWCRDASFNSTNNQTAPGIATLVTGTYPENHGIIADGWYERMEKKQVSAVGDERETTLGGSYEAGRVSPHRLLTTTLSDQMRLSTQKMSKSYGVALDATPAVLMGGQMANGAFWMDSQTGRWVTSSYYRENTADWIQSYNDKNLPATHLGRTWMTKFPAHTYSTCWPDLNAYEKGFYGRTTFPYPLPELTRNKGLEEKIALLKATPFGNTLVKDMAVALITNENLGKDSFTDVLGITFSATEYIGDLFGPQSIEMEDAYLWLDEDLQQLITFIDEFVGMENTLIILTSDHGVATPPDFIGDNKGTAGYFNTNSALSLLRSYLNALYGPGEWISSYQNQQVYLNTDFILASGKSAEAIANTATEFLGQFSGVSAAITSQQLTRNHFPDGNFVRMQKSYYSKRSGDILVNYSPGWIEKTDFVSASDSPYPYDTRVPLLWYGWKIAPKIDYEPVDMSDVTVTLSEMLKIAAPNAATGKIIIPLLP